MKVKYMKNVLINKDWIKKNKALSWQRNIYASSVNKFGSYINNGTFISSLITLAKRKGNKELSLLDGQHRVLAIEKSGKPFRMDLRIYEDLNEKEMKELYFIIGKGKSHRITDDLKVYVEDHLFLNKFLEKEFPITVSLKGGVNAMRLDILIKVAFHSDIRAITRQGITKNNLKGVLEKIDLEKYNEMKEFFSLYKKCFGEPNKENWLYKHILLVTMVKVWKANRIFYSEKDMVSAFRKVEGSAIIRQESYGVDSPTLRRLTKKVYSIINEGRKGNKFLMFWEED